MGLVDLSPKNRLKNLFFTNITLSFDTAKIIQFSGDNKYQLNILTPIRL